MSIASWREQQCVKRRQGPSGNGITITRRNTIWWWMITNFRTPVKVTVMCGACLVVVSLSTILRCVTYTGVWLIDWSVDFWTWILGYLLRCYSRIFNLMDIALVSLLFQVSSTIIIRVIVEIITSNKKEQWDFKVTKESIASNGDTDRVDLTRLAVKP